MFNLAIAFSSIVFTLIRSWMTEHEYVNPYFNMRITEYSYSLFSEILHFLSDNFVSFICTHGITDLNM